VAAQLFEVDLCDDESAIGDMFPQTSAGSLAVLRDGRADALLYWSELRLAAESDGWISFAPDVARTAHTGTIRSQCSFQVRPQQPRLVRTPTASRSTLRRHRRVRSDLSALA
jgi:hypothetical protein